MLQGLSGRGILLRQPDNGAGSGGETPNRGDPGAAGGAGASGNDTGGTPASDNQGALTFESWYGKLDATVKGLVDGHVSGLKTALSSERAALQKKVADLQKTAEKGSELEKQLADMQATLALTERRASFAEDAIRPEIGCTNVKVAYALATAENLFNSRGQADWTAIKAAAPELFRKVSPGSADGGAGVNHGPKLDMNSIIRRAAGRG